MHQQFQNSLNLSAKSKGKTDVFSEDSFEDLAIEMHGPRESRDSVVGKEIEDYFDILDETELTQVRQQIHSQGLDFKQMLAQQAANPTFDFRKNKATQVQLIKAFSEGFNREEHNEAVYLRQHAYMLVLGISVEELKNKITKSYEHLCQVALSRYTLHFDEKGRLTKETSKNQRKLAATIPLFNAIYLIQKDVSRTMCVFD